jgi:predicted dehydrogenase
MITASRKFNKFFMEAFWIRFNPSFQESLNKIKNGEIGTIKYINADFAFLINNVANKRLTDIKLGGGALMDIGVYPLFLAYMILGIPKEIIARSNFNESGADMQTSMILQYDSAQAVLHSSFLSSSNIKALISGTDGRINLNTPWYKAKSYTLIKNDQKNKYRLPLKGKGYTYEIEECHKCIKENKIESDLWSHKNSLDLIKIVDEVKNKIGLEYPS